MFIHLVVLDLSFIVEFSTPIRIEHRSFYIWGCIADQSSWTTREVSAHVFQVSLHTDSFIHICLYIIW